MVRVGVGQQHLVHLGRVHAGGAQVAQHLAQAGAEALRGSGIDQGQVVALAHQEGVDRGLQALLVFRYVAAFQQAADQCRRHVDHFLPAQRDHAVEQGGDLQRTNALVVDAGHLLGGSGRGGFGQCSQRQGRQGQQQGAAQRQGTQDHGGSRWMTGGSVVPSVPWPACARRSNHCAECSGRGCCLQGCALHLLRARATAEATATATAGYPWDGGVGPVAGDAVNPAPRSGPVAGGWAFGRLRSSASQAKRPHPWGLGRGLLVCAVLRTRQDRGGASCPTRPRYTSGPCRGHSRNRTHPAFDSFPRSVGTAYCSGRCRPWSARWIHVMRG